MQEKNARNVILPSTIEELLQDILGTKQVKVTYITEGVSTDVYKVLAGKEIYYFRLKEDGQSATAETLAHKLVIEAGAKAPQVVYNEDFNKKLGRSFLITTQIKGASLEENKTNIEQVLEDAGKDLARINSIPIERFGWIDQDLVFKDSLCGMNSTYKEFRLNECEYKLKDLVETKVLNANTIELWHKWFKVKGDDLGNINQSYLSHGDFSTPHIYHANGIYTGIIDFGDIGATSIYFDLAQFYMSSKDLFDLLLSGFKTIIPLPLDYMKNVQEECLFASVYRLYWISNNLPDHIVNGEHYTKTVIENILNEQK